MRTISDMFFLSVTLKRESRAICNGILWSSLSPPDEILPWLPNKEGVMWCALEEQNKGVNHSPCLALGRLIKQMRKQSLSLFLRGQTAYLRGSCSDYRFKSVNLNYSPVFAWCACVFSALPQESLFCYHKCPRISAKKTNLSHLSKSC